MGKKRILLLASWRMQHVRRFIDNIGKIKGDSLELDLLDNSYGYECAKSPAIDHLYTIKHTFFSLFLLKIPKIRVWFVKRHICKRLEEILHKNEYDLLSMQVVHDYAPKVVEIAHRNNVKVLLSPFGSEVLRINEKKKIKIKDAFDNADFVSTKDNSSFSGFLINTFGVDKNKFVSYGAGSDTISAIIRNKSNNSREKMSEAIGIPYSTYNICCGYNAQKEQQHSAILDALAQVRDLLPDDYQIIIPLTYGSAKEKLKESLSRQARNLNLNVVTLFDYMSTEEVSYLRLITNLFIHVQTTDAANASIQEFLLAGATCINGKWLSYPYLETKGMPYYVCDDLSTLPDTIRDVFNDNNKSIQIHSDILKEIESNSAECVSQKWLDFMLKV